MLRDRVGGAHRRSWEAAMVGHRQNEGFVIGLRGDLQPRSSYKGKALASNDPAQWRKCLSAYLRWERVAGQGGGNIMTLVGTPLPPAKFYL